VKTALKQVLGSFLALLGLLVAVFSNRIVFPGLERLLGIETIVGKDSVQYQTDGSYYYTNPTAMMEWIASVALIGVLIFSLGVWLILRARKNGKLSNQDPAPPGA
jgi:hypothetical protein